jgi:hypothetical protein
MPQVPRAVARFNKRHTNHLLMRWAPYLPPWAVVEHRGRRSGRQYATPVLATISGATVYIPVLYGEQSDWLRNLFAADGGALVRAGRRYAMSGPEMGAASSAPGVAGKGLGRVSGRVVRADITPV